ncbi:hypothetical protein COT64_02505 [Candidatus Shapirobacteria bacterium CG09_land_8_20_14_0_10_39_12]|uniref:Uncharacterized protein n=1 Tax=Candidatus Shapirobacteria bacterium CG09_land_8_20_14_0_10_39_12 TaxID=1974885 RepID=A0A2H0WRC9_9BACT|nr:MAG: hypothetical protein COT64_02505 [Candidatus Shapirobacteria bacterium CG09_land_8_20_14_0_10_39_12]
MDIGKLNKQLFLWIQSLDKRDKNFLLTRLSSLKSVYPFNEYEYRLMFLLNKKVISFEDYEKLREAYVQERPYLGLFGISPRRFGDIWAKQHLQDIDNRFQEPSKKIDLNYQGEYDLYLPQKEGIVKIEIKACRAINTKKAGELETKALNSASKEPFWMNFQQLKLETADVFIFIGVWVDRILYWVLSNKEVKQHPLRSHQHRGGIEYQIGITDKNIKEFEKYLVKPKNIVEVIIKKAKE